MDRALHSTYWKRNRVCSVANTNVLDIPTFAVRSPDYVEFADTVLDQCQMSESILSRLLKCLYLGLKHDFSPLSGISKWIDIRPTKSQSNAAFKAFALRITSACGTVVAGCCLSCVHVTTYSARVFVLYESCWFSLFPVTTVFLIFLQRSCISLHASRPSNRPRQLCLRA